MLYRARLLRYFDSIQFNGETYRNGKEFLFVNQISDVFRKKVSSFLMIVVCSRRSFLIDRTFVQYLCFIRRIKVRLDVAARSVFHYGNHSPKTFLIKFEK